MAQAILFCYNLFMDDAEIAKEKLIQELLRGGYLKTNRIVEAFRAIDRVDFLREEYRGEAYENYPLPIGNEQTISQPLTVAFMLELLTPLPGQKILDIGSGSGWTSALLAYCVSTQEETKDENTGNVFAVERLPALCKFAKKNIEKYKFISRGIVKFYCRDGIEGLEEESPFDGILASAASSKEIPAIWRKELRIGGKIVAPVNNSIWLFIKKSDTKWEEREFRGFAFVPLLQGSGTRQKSEKKRAQNSKCRIGYWLLIISALLGLAANEIFLPHASYTDAKTIEITRGSGSRKIGDLLKKEGVIRSKWAFVVYTAITGKISSLKPGQYEFKKESISQITNDLMRGGNDEITITIPEGWNNKELAEFIGDVSRTVSKEDVLKVMDEKKTNTFVEKFEFLKDKPENTSLEGYLFPDTYRIFYDATAEDIINKTLENFDRKIPAELREEIARQKKTLFEVVTMASLIEKEVSSDDDRRIVSGILWKRLNVGIPLQVDATISYLKNQTAGNKNQEDARRISIANTKIDSPYNTYKYRGLPKGPIANPGLSAIKAAVYPQKSPYLYYLSAPGGRTIFSKTLEEHHAAQRKYLR